MPWREAARTVVTMALLARPSRWAAAIALLCGVLLTPTTPAYADGILDNLLGQSSPVAADGVVKSPDAVLKKGCQPHRFRYRVTVPAGSAWGLELSMIDRRGRSIAAAYKRVNGDPTNGTGVFRFCSQTAKPGKYRIRSKLSWTDITVPYEKVLATEVFRLRRR